MWRTGDRLLRRDRAGAEHTRREGVEALQRSQVAYAAAWASTCRVVSPSLREFLR